MPVPSLVTDLSTTVASNSPAGSDNVFPDLDNYLRTLSAFLASIRDNSGNGWVSPYLTAANPSYTGTLTGGTGVVNLGSGQLVKDAAGNLGLGVTPSAWGSVFKNIDVSTASAGGTAGGAYLAFNTYYNASAQWIYKTTNQAGYYAIEGVTHKWFNAPSGTAGTAITFTQAMTLDGSGRLMVGTTTAAGMLTVSAPASTSYGTFDAVSQGSAALTLKVNGAVLGYLGCANAFVTGGTGTQTGVRAEGDLLFATGGGTERARITSAGDLLVGTTTNTGNYKANVQFDGGSTNGLLVRNSSATGAPTLLYVLDAQSLNNTTQAITYTDSTAERFSVRKNGGIANYSANNVALSDERLKTDIQPATSYLDKICAIPVKTFLYKDQTDTERNLGVIAQDVDAVAPELIDHSGFGEAPQGESPYLAVYQTDLQYALMKCIQEQQALITALTARVAALEA